MYEVRRGRLIIVAGALLLIILVQTAFIFSMSMRCETSQQKTPAVIKTEEVSISKISQYLVQDTQRARPPPQTNLSHCAASAKFCDWL